MTERGRGIALQLFAFAAFFVLWFTGLAPFNYEFPLDGIEGGWLAASVYAGLHRFAYGTQFVFTNGPLFPLYHREYAGELSGWFSLGRLAVVLFLAWGMSRLSVTVRPVGWLIVIVVFAIFWPTITYQANDGLLLVVPLLLALLVLADRIGWPGLLLGTVATAAVGLAKVSLIPFSLGALLLADIALLSRQRAPVALLLYVAAGFGLFILSGQQWNAFVPFLLGSLEMTAGYSAALALNGPLYEFAAFLTLAGLTVLVLLAQEVASVRANAERPITAVLRLLLVLGLIFIAIKAGFVRQDGHTLASWGAFAFLVILLGLPATVAGWRAIRTWIYYALPILFVLVGFGYSWTTGFSWKDLTTTSARVFATQLRDAGRFVTDHANWQSDQRAMSDDANAKILVAQPLPAVAGTVDSISNIQSALIAAGLDYRPRPTIQENMTFSPALIERNRAFLTSGDAPGTLLFAPGATDGRHPASIEGSLWPLIVADYAVTGRAGNQLILTRRTAPILVAESTASEGTTTFDTDIALPTGGPVFLSLDISETLVGKLVDQAFKPPLVWLTVSYADGTSNRYRLIPGMISQGMVVSPTIDTIEGFEAFAHGADLSGLRFPVSVRVSTDGVWAYAPAIGVHIQSLTVPAN